MSERLKVAVFGDGPAGLATSHFLNNSGADVELHTQESEQPPYRSIYTTGRDLTTAQAALIPENLRRRLSGVRIVTQKGQVKLPGVFDYFMVDYPGFVKHLVQRVITEGIPIITHSKQELQNIKIGRRESEVAVDCYGSKKVYDYLVDATGLHAVISRKTQLGRAGENPLVEYLYGGKFRGEIAQNEMMLVIGPGSGTSWVCPSVDDNGTVDIVFSMWGNLVNMVNFKSEATQKLGILVDFLIKNSLIRLDRSKPEDIISGAIRSQPTPCPSYGRVYAVGDSAGMGKPGTAQLFDRTIKMADLAATHMQNGQNAQDYWRAWNSIFTWDWFFYYGVTERLKEQDQNTLGGTFNSLIEWVRNGSNPERLVRQFEELFVDGKLDASFLLKLLSDRDIRSGLSRAAWRYFNSKA